MWVFYKHCKTFNLALTQHPHLTGFAQKLLEMKFLERKK